MNPERMGNLPGQLLQNPPHRPPSGRTHNRGIQRLHIGSSSGVIQEQRSSFRWIVLPSCGHVLQLLSRTAGLCLEDEWAQNILQYGLVILFVSLNHYHHIIIALYIWEEHCKCWSEHFICFWFCWLLVFLQHSETMGIHFLATPGRHFFLLCQKQCRICVQLQQTTINVMNNFTDENDPVFW